METAFPRTPANSSIPKLTYSPPKAATYRRVLANGVVAFLAEDHDFPLVNVSVLVRTGSYLDPKGKEGLGAMMGNQLRAGGTTSLPPDKFDEEVDFLAATINSGVGDTQGTANLNCLSKDIDKALELFASMLKTPGFQQDRIDLYKNQALQGMERRNDKTESIQAREWGRLMRGDQHFSTIPTTKPSIESITRQDLIDFHKKYYHPGGFILAVSGDFKTSEMISRLEKMFQGWPTLTTSVPTVPKPMQIPVPGVYMVNKSDVNQGRVSIGHLGNDARQSRLLCAERHGRHSGRRRIYLAHHVARAV